MFNHKSILITGGTGSFGNAFMGSLLVRFPKIRKLVVFSRDELKQSQLKQAYPASRYPQLQFLIGDVRDAARLRRVCEGMDIIVHAAALKQVDTAEYNPDECIKTNIIGAQNVIDAALSTTVTDVVSLSTDKACAPANLYGATKLVSDKLFVAANNIRGSRNIRFSVVRYGNVMGSRGSVVPLFMKLKAGDEVPITHPEMTRFNISLEAGVNLVLFAIGHHLGGEIFVPKIPSFRIMDLAEAIAPSCKKVLIGIRPGEKLHEELITETDALQTIDLGPCFAILPSFSHDHSREDYLAHHHATPVEAGFRYYSATNAEWETVESLRQAIVDHIQPQFKPI